jgi:glycosyltransferase involved in cell wall biosynthesis
VGLSWASQILIVDSGSTDATLQIAAQCPHTRVVQRPFDDFASQCNFGLSLIETPWVLSLDADYQISDEFRTEIAGLEPKEATAGFRAGFVYRIFGYSLRGALYPPRIVLYRRERASYRNEGHGHRVVIDGQVADLKYKIFHDDRKPLSRWFASQQSYARLEADYLLTASPSELRMPDRLRRTAWLAPFAAFFYVLVVRGCIFDGWPGWVYALQRTLAEIMIALEILDRRLRSRPMIET